MKKIFSQIEILEKNISHAFLENTLISSANIGWHIEHSLLVLKMVVKAIKTTNPTAYAGKFNFNKTMVLVTGKIPRGRAKAPKMVRPIEEITIDNLKQNIATVKLVLNELPQCQPNQYFDHPYFGHLKLKPTIKFLSIHTNHHINIINDILKTSKI